MALTITEFLDARIAEYEAEIRYAPKGSDPYDSKRIPLTGPLRARLLAECSAKRAIIAEHTPVDYSGIGMASPNACRICGVETSMSDWEWSKNSFPCATLQALASVYADHTDYQQEWAL